MTTVDHGFKLDALRAELNREDWEDDPENPGSQIRRTWLGTFQGLTPSGKYYLPFACSNLDTCQGCDGSGSHEPRTGRRIRKRAKRRGHDFSKGVIKRGCMGALPAQRYAARVQPFRDAAYRRVDTTCLLCNGMGSREAYLDELWHETTREAFEAIGVSLDCDGGDYFASEYRDTPENVQGEEIIEA